MQGPWARIRPAAAPAVRFGRRHLECGGSPCALDGAIWSAAARRRFARRSSLRRRQGRSRLRPCIATGEAPRRRRSELRCESASKLAHSIRRNGLLPIFQHIHGQFVVD
jgi:hypothetical protein